MTELVKVIAVSLVDHPDEIVVTEKETENSIILEYMLHQMIWAK